MEISEIKTIGVIGCGLMGAGIIETCSKAGYSIIAREVNEELLQKGLKAVRGSLNRQVEKGKLAQADMDAALGRIHGAVDLAELKDCDLVIEAVIEDMALKRSLFAELDGICRPGVVLASNTSSLSVTEMAAATQRPELVLGLHFFNPVPVMPLLEVVRGVLTGDEAVILGRALGEKLGKSVVVVRDRPGFIVNLLLLPFLLDAIRWLDAGLATKEEIDTAIKGGLNHPLGPIALADLIGLDTVLFIADTLYDGFRESRYAAPPVLRRMVKAGMLGRKTGRGFYNYK